MNNVFNSVQTHGTKEDCTKFSKSVSYETLVGGTTTTGREYNDVVGIEGVITRRTIVRRGYLPEQGAHANKESLFASVTCFMRLPRRIQRMLLAMTIPVLALVFTLATIAESRAADCPAGKESCGTNCCYTIENGTVNFSRIDETQKASIKNVAFANKNLSGQLVIPDWINAIGTNAFIGNNLTSVILPDTISRLEQFGFAYNPNLKEIVFPDSITANKVYDPFFYDTAKGVTIKCKGDMQKCQDNLAKFKKIDGKCSLQYSSYCYDLSFDTASEEQCNSTNYYWTGTECVYEPEVAKRTCTYDETGYIKVGNYCYSPEVTYAKKHYTPAEANQWLRDGNDNFVVLTFKK